MDEFEIGANCNRGELRKKYMQRHRANLKYGRIEIWAICKSPLQRAQKNPYHARDAFLCIYMYICEHPDNTRVGANCN